MDRITEVWHQRQEARRHRPRLRQVGQHAGREAHRRDQRCEGVRRGDGPRGRAALDAVRRPPSTRASAGPKSADRRAATERRYRGTTSPSGGTALYDAICQARNGRWKPIAAVPGDSSTLRHRRPLRRRDTSSSVQTLAQLQSRRWRPRRATRPASRSTPSVSARTPTRRRSRRSPRPPTGGSGSPRATPRSSSSTRTSPRTSRPPLGPLSALRRGWAWVASSPHCGATGTSSSCAGARTSATPPTSSSRARSRASRRPTPSIAIGSRRTSAGSRRRSPRS